MNSNARSVARKSFGNRCEICAREAIPGSVAVDGCTYDQNDPDQRPAQ